MGRKVDYVRKRYQPMLDKHLKGAIAHRIGQDFPRVGGLRIRTLCAEMILDVVNEHIRPKDVVRHGQILWLAISIDDPPSRGKTTADTQLVPVVLDVSTDEDIQARIDRVSTQERLRNRLIRVCHQAYEQKGLLSNSDLAEIFCNSDARIAKILAEYERNSGKVVPRRATLHDVGTGRTHKRIICYARYVEGKLPDQVARETHHTVEAVDRYLGQYARVRHCRKEGMSPEETAYTLRCSLNLVHEYLAIDRYLEQEERG